ncbi:hypothetical protein A2U01_0108197, partial [Trifolium medium]|nr:hypothetical protein [Trifolium medium]
MHVMTSDWCHSDDPVIGCHPHSLE